MQCASVDWSTCLEMAGSFRYPAVEVRPQTTPAGERLSLSTSFQAWTSHLHAEVKKRWYWAQETKSSAEGVPANRWEIS